MHAALMHAALLAQTPQQLGDLMPGSGSGGGDVLGLSPRAGEVLFLADDGINGAEVWATDGTPAGTRMLRDMTPGSASSGILALSSTAGLALLRVNWGTGVNHELWVTDGTSAGTSRLMSVASNAGLSPFADLVAPGVWTFGLGNSLWRTDGTSAGTWPLPAPPGSTVGTLGSLTVLQGFQGVLVATDGNTAATIGSLPGQVRQFPNGWLQMRLTWTGQSPLATVRWLDRPGSPTLTFTGWSAEPLEVPNGFLFVRAILPSARELLFWDGNQSFPISPQFTSLTDLHQVGDTWWFQAESASGSEGRELWITDGTPAGTRVVDLVPGPASSTPQWLGNLRNGAIYWIDTPAFGTEPWFVDGTIAGSFLLQDLEPGAGGSLAASMMDSVGGQRRRLIVASTAARGFELWATDGTVAGSSFLNEIRPGPGSAFAFSPYPFTRNAVGDAALFFADDGVNGREPWLLPLPGTSTPLRNFGASRLVAGDPVLGTAMPIEVTGIPAGNLGAVVLGLPDPAGLLLSPGRPLHVAAPSATVPALFAGGAPWTGSLNVPNLPAAIGLDAVLQIVESNAAAPIGWSAGAAVWLTFGL